MTYKFLKDWISDEKIHDKQDGCELIDEAQIKIVYDAVIGSTPSHGYKRKHKQAIRILEDIIIDMYWWREEADLQNFVKEYRLKKLTENKQ